MVATMLVRAGVPESALPELVSAIWASHVDHNLWSVVPEGFSAAMADLRASGVKTAIVSNSEGMLDRLFAKLGIEGCFDALIDSGRVHVEKPDPAIFRIAAERTGTNLVRSLHLGDTHSTDVVGALNAGMATALIDPFGHYAGLYAEIPRVAGVVEVAREIIRARAG
jgi:putative hydrolase of the HAD superfamily